MKIYISQNISEPIRMLILEKVRKHIAHATGEDVSIEIRKDYADYIIEQGESFRTKGNVIYIPAMDARTTQNFIVPLVSYITGSTIGQKTLEGKPNIEFPKQAPIPSVIILWGKDEKPTYMLPKSPYYIFLTIAENLALYDLITNSPIKDNVSYILGSVEKAIGPYFFVLTDKISPSAVGIISYDKAFNDMWQDIQKGKGKKYLFIKGLSKELTRIIAPYAKEIGYKIVTLVQEIDGSLDEVAHIVEYKEEGKA